MLVRLLVLAALLAAPLGAVESVKWSDKLPTDPAWLAGEQGRAIAENLLLYQYPSGGWPKNIDMAKPLTPAEKAELEDRVHDDATIDNGATTTQIRFLARAFTATNEPRYRAATERGLDYLLAAQYANGGWPQYFPLRKGYYTRITFNDDAMVRVLEVLRDAARGAEPFAWVDAARRERAAAAVERGIACILRCQVRQDGRLTAWAAQHDEVTLAPAWARKFEPPSLASQESAGIVRFLMGVRQPTPEIVAAIEAAVAWFERTKIEGRKWQVIDAPGQPEGKDRVVIADAKAKPIWARFYELGTDRPIFIGRDAVIRYDVAEIEHERRNGYAWYVTAPRDLLARDYPAWKQRLAPAPNTGKP
jgi:PelA/Pel-15E family pectate lyase